MKTLSGFFFQLAFTSIKKFALNTEDVNLNLFYSKPSSSEVKRCPEPSVALARSYSLCNSTKHFVAEKAGTLSPSAFLS